MSANGTDYTHLESNIVPGIMAVMATSLKDESGGVKVKLKDPSSSPAWRLDMWATFVPFLRVAKSAINAFRGIINRG